MTFKYKNVYLNNTSTVVGPYENNGPLKKYFDYNYDDFYMNCKTFEQAEVELNKKSFSILLNKSKIKKDDIDVCIGGDLLNQIVATNYSNINNDIPLIGIYSACSTSILGIILASNMIENSQIKNAVVIVSSHNNTSEKQFRNPIEYGGPKKTYTTFTTTGSAACLLSQVKSFIKIESGTLGSVVDMGVSDVSNMGAVMAPAAAKTIYNHLKETKRDVNYYDLILTGDLGIVGKNILKEYMYKEYNIDLKKLDDSACMIYDINNQPVYSGGSGPACLPLVTYGYILNLMKEKKLKKILLVATGALMNTTMCNQKLSIPSIAHAISIVLEDNYAIY